MSKVMTNQIECKMLDNLVINWKGSFHQVGAAKFRKAPRPMAISVSGRPTDALHLEFEVMARKMPNDLRWLQIVCPSATTAQRWMRLRKHNYLTCHIKFDHKLDSASALDHHSRKTVVTTDHDCFTRLAVADVACTRVWVLTRWHSHTKSTSIRPTRSS